MCIDSVARALAMEALGAFIAGAKNIPVGLGGDYPDLLTAWNSLNGLVIAQNAGVVFNIAAGVTNATSPVLLQGPFAGRCTVQGASPVLTTVSSVQSSSGSAGNYSIVLNVGTVAEVSTGNYALIESASGGTRHNCLEGCWIITNVDAVNTRITITSTLRIAGALPSGAIAATLTVLKSVLSFTGCDGLQIWGGAAAINLQDVVLAGDGSSFVNGISLQDVGRVYTKGHVGVVNWGRWGLYANYNSQINSDGTVAVSGCGVDGCFIDCGAAMDITYLISNGNNVNGVYCNGGYARGVTLITCGNTNSGCYAIDGGIIVPLIKGISSGNGGNGYQFDTNGYVLLTNATGADNVANLNSVFTFSHPSEIDLSIGGSVRATFAAGTTTLNGTGLSLYNSTPSTSYTAYYISSDGAAKVQYRTGSNAAKWEVGHDGSSGSYRYTIYGDVLGASALSIRGSDNYIGTLGVTSPTVPLHVGGAIRTATTTVGSLISASTAGAGTRQFVTDSTVAASGNFGAIVAGNGTNGVPVYSDGTNWRIG